MSLRRPSAADVRPGSELYERIIRVLRGERQWTKTSVSNREESRRPIVKQSSSSICNVVANVNENFPEPFNANCSETLANIETSPSTRPLKRPCHVLDAGQASAVEQRFETASEATATASTSSTEVSSEQTVAVTSPVMRPPPLLEHNTEPVQCAVAQKLQIISQADKTCSSKPQSKYKPPYKIEKSRKSSRVFIYSLIS